MRKLDGMIMAEAPPLVLATGIMWMGLLWIIWGSSDFWAITNFGVVAAPALGLWLLLPKIPRRARQGKTYAGERLASPGADPGNAGKL